MRKLNRLTNPGPGCQGRLSLEARFAGIAVVVVAASIAIGSAPAAAHEGHEGSEGSALPLSPEKKYSKAYARLVQQEEAFSDKYLAAQPGAKVDGQWVLPKVSTMADRFLFLYTLGESSASMDPADGLSLSTPQGRVTLKPTGTSTDLVPVRSSESAAVLYRDAYPNADLAVVPSATGLTVFVHRKNDAAPTTFDWKIGDGLVGDKFGNGVALASRDAKLPDSKAAPNLAPTTAIDIAEQYESTRRAYSNLDDLSVDDAPDALISALDTDADSSTKVEADADSVTLRSSAEWTGFSLDAPSFWKQTWKRKDGVLIKPGTAGFDRILFPYDGSTAYSHGPDPYSAAAPSDPVAAGNFDSYDPYPYEDRNPACSTTHNFTALYAWQSTPINNTIKGYIRQVLKVMSGRVNSDAVNSGGPGSRFKVRCNEENVPAVWQFQAASNNFDLTIAQAMNAGYRDWITKWLIFTEYPGPVLPGIGAVCGLGTIVPDDSKWIYNLNNVGNANGSGHHWNQSYAVVYHGCWNDKTSALHEATHIMGSTQQSAPFGTGAGHCTIESDVLCYDDNGPTSSPMYWNVCYHQRYDCGKQTYFNAAPSSANYLYSHWNLGQSENSYLARP